MGGKDEAVRGRVDALERECFWTFVSARFRRSLVLIFTSANWTAFDDDVDDDYHQLRIRRIRFMSSDPLVLLRCRT